MTKDSRAGRSAARHVSLHTAEGAIVGRLESVHGREATNKVISELLGVSKVNKMMDDISAASQVSKTMDDITKLSKVSKMMDDISAVSRIRSIRDRQTPDSRADNDVVEDM